MIIALVIAPPYGAETTPEYQVKAAFIFKFSSYVRWPDTRNATPFVIGVLGADPFGGSLQDVVRDQVVQGRAIRVKMLSRTDDALGCDVVFISSSEGESLDKILALLQRAPVLTVSDMDQFAGRGGMIGLTMTADRHIHFEINTNAMEHAGLRASSQLLKLATIVGRERGRN